MNYILETKNLTKKYGSHYAAKDVNIHLEKGQIYGLVGRNGAGKTTILRMLSGLSKPTSGTFDVFGKEGLNNSVTRKRVGCLIENPGIFPKLSARDNLIIKCKAIGVPDRKVVDELLEMVGLSGTGKKKAGAFSLGMKQRLGIAMTFIGNPDIVILDEPINGLDPQGIIEVRETIERLNRERNISFIISSHLLDELSKIANKYGFIQNGELIEEITWEQLVQKCTKRVEICVDNTEKAMVELDKMGIKDMVVVDKNHIKVMDGIDRTPDMLRQLIHGNVAVYELMRKNESLEDYYINVTGGGKNV